MSETRESVPSAAELRDEMRAEVRQLRIKNERLRAALTTALDSMVSVEEFRAGIRPDFPRLDMAISFARAALKEK